MLDLIRWFKDQWADNDGWCPENPYAAYPGFCLLLFVLWLVIFHA